MSRDIFKIFDGNIIKTNVIAPLIVALVVGIFSSIYLYVESLIEKQQTEHVRMFLVDLSGRMNSSVNNSGLTAWELAQQVLYTSIDILPSKNTATGLRTFGQNNMSCEQQQNWENPLISPAKADWEDNILEKIPELAPSRHNNRSGLLYAMYHAVKDLQETKKAEKFTAEIVVLASGENHCDIENSGDWLSYYVKEFKEKYEIDIEPKFFILSKKNINFCKVLHEKYQSKCVVADNYEVLEDELFKLNHVLDRKVVKELNQNISSLPISDWAYEIIKHSLKLDHISDEEYYQKILKVFKNHNVNKKIEYEFRGVKESLSFLKSTVDIEYNEVNVIHDSKRQIFYFIPNEVNKISMAEALALLENMKFINTGAGIIVEEFNPKAKRFSKELGLESGDLILSINGEEIDEEYDVINFMSGFSNHDLTMVIYNKDTGYNFKYFHVL